MQDRKFGQVEDYTDAFLGMFYLVLVMALVMIWGVWGYVAALGVCACLHVGIQHLGLRRARAEAAWDARVEAALKRARARRD